MKVKVVSNKSNEATVKTISGRSVVTGEQEQYGHHFDAEQFLTYEISEKDFCSFCARVQVYVGVECLGQAFITSCHFTECTGTIKAVIINTTLNVCGDILF